jgi:hypothetical protein
MEDRLIPLVSHGYYLKNWMFRQPVERTWASRTFSPLDAGCLRAAIVTLCSSTIGAGALALPYAVSRCGLLLGLALMIVVGISFVGYYRILVRVSMGFESHSYLQVVEAYFGSGWKRAAEVFVLLFCTAMVAALQTILCELGVALLPAAIGPSTQATRFLFLAIINALILFPLCRFPQLTSLRYVSLIPLISITCVMLLSLWDLQDLRWDKVVWYKLDLGVCEAVCIMYFSFDASINIPAIHNELTKPSFKRMEKVIMRGLTLITGIYLLVGSLEYATNAGSVPEIFVLQAKFHWGTYISQILVALNIIVEVPLMVHPVRLCMEQLFLMSDGKLCVPGRIMLFPLLLLPVIAATFMPNAVMYFEILGATFTVTTGFIVPSKVHLALLFLKFSNSLIKKLALFLWTSLLTAAACVCIFLICDRHFHLLNLPIAS